MLVDPRQDDLLQTEAVVTKKSSGALGEQSGSRCDSGTGEVFRRAGAPPKAQLTPSLPDRLNRRRRQQTTEFGCTCTSLVHWYNPDDNHRLSAVQTVNRDPSWCLSARPSLGSFAITEIITAPGYIPLIAPLYVPGPPCTLLLTERF